MANQQLRRFMAVLGIDSARPIIVIVSQHGASQLLFSRSSFSRPILKWRGNPPPAPKFLITYIETFGHKLFSQYSSKRISCCNQSSCAIYHFAVVFLFFAISCSSLYSKMALSLNQKRFPQAHYVVIGIDFGTT